jgi:hypothetical protein
MMQCMQLTDIKSHPKVVYDYLSYMRDIGKRECMTDQQLDDAKKMIKWTNAVKDTHPDTYESPYTDSTGSPVYLHQCPNWFKDKFVSLDNMEVVDKKAGQCCNFCDTWTNNKGECSYCYIGRYQ